MTTQKQGKLSQTAWTFGITGMAAAATIALAATTMTTYAGAETAAVNSKYQTTFINHYNQNLQLETQLVQKAEAEGGSSQTITSLSQTVQSIDTQVSALYAAEQSLVSARANISVPAADSNQAKTLKADKQTLMHNIAAAKNKVKVDLKSKHKIAARRLQLQIKIWEAEINQLNFQLSHLNTGTARWNHEPYDGGLTELQQTIFDLQKSAIHYAEAWLGAAKPISATVNPASITGLSYSMTNVTIPTAGSAAVVDSVAVLPLVKGTSGNVLEDVGTFTIAGPSGADGVSVDSITGQVNVDAGATAGTYIVTYTQGTLSDSVSIIVSQ